MKNNFKYKAISGLIPAFLISCNSGAQDPNQIKIGTKTISREQLTAANNGEIIYLYKSANDKVPQKMLTNLNKNDLSSLFLENSEKLHLRTYIMVKDTADYQFLPEISNAQVFINSKLINGKTHLAANNLYALDVVLKKSIPKNSLALTWIKTTSDGSKSEEIPFANLYLPTENIFAPNLTKAGLPSIKLDDLTDTSGNGIPDDWSINGYTSIIKNGRIIIEKWDDKIHRPLKKTKFYSSPYKWSTAGDPFSDYQKVTGIGLDNSIAKEARNPLIAAYPEITVELDGMVISKNQKVTDTTNGSTTKTITVTKSTAELTQNSHKAGISLGGEWGKPKLLSLILSAIKPTASYEYNKVTSTTVTDSESDAEAIMEGWINAIEINDAQAAYLTPLVHYYNRGTAPAYNVKPKYNLAYKNIDNGIVSLKTIEAQMAEQANLIAPNLAYPRSAQDSVVVASNNMSLITINKQQLEILEKTKEIFLNNLETTASLSLKSGNNDTKLVDWAPYLNQINHSSALIELATPDGSMLSRRAVARPVDENEDLIESLNPELSLDEALKLTYNLNMTESKMENNDYIYYGFILNITGKKNLDEINKQLNKNGNKLGDIKLKTGMIFTIIPDGLTYDKNTEKYYFYESGVGTLLNESANASFNPSLHKIEDIKVTIVTDGSPYQIYANGKMQVPVNVQVKIKDYLGNYVKLPDTIKPSSMSLVTLYDKSLGINGSGSLLDIDNIGGNNYSSEWKVGRIRNEFINVARGISSQDTDQSSFNGWNNYTYYVTTTKPTKLKELCARVGILGKYQNSCDGFTKILAITPPQYSLNDFIVSGSYLSEDYNKLKVRLIKLTPSSDFKVRKVVTDSAEYFEKDNGKLILFGTRDEGSYASNAWYAVQSNIGNIKVNIPYSNGTNTPQYYSSSNINTDDGSLYLLEASRAKGIKGTANPLMNWNTLRPITALDEYGNPITIYLRNNNNWDLDISATKPN